MSASPALNLQDFQQEQLWEDFCQMVHKSLDNILSGLKDSFFAEKPLNLKEMSDLFQGKKQELASSMLQEFINSQYAQYLEQQKATCPHCGREVCKNEDSSRIIETLLGKSKIVRPYFYCRRCKFGFAPLDEALELSSRRKQDDLQQIALEFLSEMPFDRASELFEKSTGVSFSDHRQHDCYPVLSTNQLSKIYSLRVKRSTDE